MCASSALVDGSGDDTVQVRLRFLRPGLINVYVITRLSGKFPRVLLTQAEDAETFVEAWRAGQEVWLYLSVVWR